MVIGVLQFELVIPDSGSLKDKRRVVRSLRDRLHKEHMVSVAEVGALDSLNVAVMAAAVVAGDGRRAGEVLDRIIAKLHALRDAELAGMRRDILRGEELPDPAAGDGEVGEEIARELLDYYDGRTLPPSAGGAP